MYERLQVHRSRRRGGVGVGGGGSRQRPRYACGRRSGGYSEQLNHLIASSPICVSPRALPGSCLPRGCVAFFCEGRFFLDGLDPPSTTHPMIPSDPGLAWAPQNAEVETKKFQIVDAGTPHVPSQSSPPCLLAPATICTSHALAGAPHAHRSRLPPPRLLLRLNCRRWVHQHRLLRLPPPRYVKDEHVGRLGLRGTRSHLCVRRCRECGLNFFPRSSERSRSASTTP